jgi:outer membrane immunogenic protein
MALVIAGALFSTAAVAADFPAYQPAPVVVARVYDWTGIYIGGNVGYGFATRNRTASSSFNPGLSFTASEDLNGAVGGLQLGGNFQTGNFVIGLEIDGMASGQKNTGSVASGFITFDDEVTWLATARLRVGAAIDRLLIYATGGGAYGEFKQTVNTPAVFFFGRPIFPPTTTVITTQRAGFAAGAGLEYAFTAGLIGRVEYLFLRSADETNTILGVAVTNHLTDNIVRVALSYKFGGANF